MLSASLLKNTSYAAIDKISTISIGLIFIPLGIRFLGADLFGLYIILMMFTLTGALSFLDIGFATGVEYFVSLNSQNNIELAKIINTSLSLFFLLGTVSTLIFYYFLPYVISFVSTDIVSVTELNRYLTLITFILWLQFIMTACTAILQGLSRFDIIYQANIFYNIIQNILVLALIYINGDLSMVFETIAIISIIKFIHLYLYLPNRKAGNLVTFENIKEIASYSFLIFINRLIGLVNNQIDRLLIIKILSPLWMTVYEVVTKPIAPLSHVVQISNAALLPKIVEKHAIKDKDGIKKLYKNIVRYNYLLILPISCFLALYIEELLTLWVGKEYIEYADISRVVILTYLMLPILSTCGLVIAGIKEVKATFKYTVISMMINAILSLLLIQSFGLIGLLWATFVATLYLLIVYPKILDTKLLIQSKIHTDSTKIALFHLPLITLLLLNLAIATSIYLSIALAFILVAIQYLANFIFYLDTDEKSILKNIFKSNRAITDTPKI